MKRLVPDVTREIILSILIIAAFGVLAGCATPLLRNAAKSGDINAVRTLLDKGADVNEKDGVGGTPLFWAVREGHTELAKLLIEKGADVNKGTNIGETPLYTAVSHGHTELAKLLIQKGTDIDAAISSLRSYGRPRGIAGANMLETIRAKQELATHPPQTISKEDLKTIVQAAVEGATQAQKPEVKTAVKTDIDNPSFNPSQIVMGENDLAVIIGIEGYQSLPKSDFSFDDAKLVKDYVKALGFRERNIEFITDERATKSGIEKTIEAWLPNRVKKDSRVIIQFGARRA